MDDVASRRLASETYASVLYGGGSIGRESDGDVALRECSAIDAAKKAESTHLELVELLADLLELVELLSDLLDGALGES
jgi:hypothetical protein